MYLPQIGNITNNRKMMNIFKGYNHCLVTGDGEFNEMYNMTTDQYPVMSSRVKRAYIRSLIKPNGMSAADELAFVDGTTLYYSGEPVCQVEDSEKVFVRMGAYLCVFPDKIMYNTYDGTVKGMENHYAQSGNEVIFEPCTLDGGSLNQGAYETTEPSTTDRTDGMYWFNNGVLTQWSVTYQMWTPVATSYMLIYEKGELQNNRPTYLPIDTGFEEGDTVTISGCENEDYNGDFLIYKIVGRNTQLSTIKGIVISAVGTFSYYNTEIKIDRTVPDMDFVCEHNNRLWGCSSEAHEIYACKLGDPSNWRNYTGLADDAYAVTVGTPGGFTGCIAHGGYVLFFKEKYIHRLYGTEPANFNLMTIECRGVQKDSEKSLCVINEVLYYKSRNGIVRYDGSLPVDISEEFGKERYSRASGGTYNGKYMVSMQDSTYGWHVFVYDTQKGLWSHEDNKCIKYFANHEGALYFMDSNNMFLVQPEYMINLLFPNMTVLFEETRQTILPGMFYPGEHHDGYYENDVEWSAETGDMTMEYPDYKYVSRLILRLSVEDGGTFNVSAQYDSDGIWENILSINSTRKRSVSIPVRIRRCDHMKIRYSGKGSSKLYSITYNVEQGSEL